MSEAEVLIRSLRPRIVEIAPGPTWVQLASIGSVSQPDLDRREATKPGHKHDRARG